MCLAPELSSVGSWELEDLGRLPNGLFWVREGLWVLTGEGAVCLSIPALFLTLKPLLFSS